MRAPIGSWPGRVLALAAATAAAAHLWTALGHRHGGWATALLLVMAVACLPCAAALWRSPASAHATASLMAMSLAMAAVHWLLVLGAGTGGHVGHGAGHGSGGFSAGVGAGGADAVMPAMVAGELVIAWGTALWRSRLRTVTARAGAARSGPTGPTSAVRPVRVSR